MNSLFWCEIDFSSCLAFSTAMLMRDWMWFIIWNMEAGLLAAPSSSFFEGLLTFKKDKVGQISGLKKKHLLPSSTATLINAVHVVIRPHLGLTNVRVRPATRSQREI